MPHEIEAVAARFAVAGQLGSAQRVGAGHINDSHLLTYRQGAATVRFVLQRINTAIFRAPALVMDNVRRVTAHIAQRMQAQGVSDVGRRVLTLVPTHAGEPCDRDDAGDWWRMYRFVERTRVCRTAETPEHAYQAGRAFGTFQRLLADLPGPRLHETIPDFHNTPVRLDTLAQVVHADPSRRVAGVQAEIEFVRDRRSLAGALLALQQAGTLPERVVHNDAKIDNVLLDDQTGVGLCVVDLDTVMPGLAPYDFGDMVRSMTSPTAEDEVDLTRVAVRMPVFEALARGYLEAAGDMLTDAEREHLVLAAKLITLEQGVRFLTDYLSGDTYYKTQRPGQNLDRCRTQLKLLDSIERNEAQMNQIVGRL